jgi:hypothetical protein
MMTRTWWQGALVALAVAAPSWGAAPAGQYAHEDGGETVRDLKTGLGWQVSTSSATRAWEDALADCNASRVGGHVDWRLPSFKELLTLVDFQRSAGPTIDEGWFPGTPLARFWTSTPNANRPDLVWTIWFDLGYPDEEELWHEHWVRCVR